MSELIDRQAALDAIKFAELGQEYDEVEKVQIFNPWHRVEKELPNDGEWAIFTNGKVVSVERFKEDAYNHFFPASEWFDFEDAIAWMPLPEPPKEENDGN